MKQKIKTTLTTLTATTIGWSAIAQGALASGTTSTEKTTSSSSTGVQAYAPSTNYANQAGLPTTNAIDFALNIGRALFSLLGLIALVLIIYGGFLLLTSQGESDKVKKGRDTLIWSIVGIIVILSSLGILTYIDSILFSASS